MLVIFFFLFFLHLFLEIFGRHESVEACQQMKRLKVNVLSHEKNKPKTSVDPIHVERMLISCLQLQPL